MPRKGLLEANMWFWIGLVIMLLVFFLLYSIQQAGQHSIESNIQIGDTASGAGLNYVHDESKISLEETYPNYSISPKSYVLHYIT